MAAKRPYMTPQEIQVSQGWAFPRPLLHLVIGWNVGVFSRGTTRISGSLSCGARATSGLSLLEQLERQAEFHSSTQDEA